MKRLTIGAALGGAAVYFLDPQSGERRRRQVQSLWRENRDTVVQAGEGVTRAAVSVPPLVRRVRRGLESGDWAEERSPGWGPRIAGLIGAVALGGAVMYFLDAEQGGARRGRILAFMHEQRGAFNDGFRDVQDRAGSMRQPRDHADEPGATGSRA